MRADKKGEHDRKSEVVHLFDLGSKHSYWQMTGEIEIQKVFQSF